MRPVDWRLRLWLAVFLAVLVGVAMAVLVVTAEWHSGEPRVVDVQMAD